MSITDEEALSQLADEPDDLDVFEDDFSDPELSLPDIEELLKGC